MSLANILSFGGSIASGGILGGLASLIGLGIKSWANYKEQKEEHRHKEEIIKLSMQATKVEAEARVKIADKEIDKEIAKADGEIQKMTYQSDTEITKALMQDFTGYGKHKGFWLAFLQETMLLFKASVRPTLAYFTTVYAIVIFYKLYTLLGGLESIPTNQLMDIFKELLATFSFAFISVINWYFYSRPVEHKR